MFFPPMKSSERENKRFSGLRKNCSMHSAVQSLKKRPGCHGVFTEEKHAPIMKISLHSTEISRLENLSDQTVETVSSSSKIAIQAGNLKGKNEKSQEIPAPEDTEDCQGATACIKCKCSAEHEIHYRYTSKKKTRRNY